MDQEWRCQSRNKEKDVIKLGLNNHYESINQWVVFEPEIVHAAFHIYSWQFFTCRSNSKT